MLDTIAFTGNAAIFGIMLIFVLCIVAHVLEERERREYEAMLYEDAQRATQDVAPLRGAYRSDHYHRTGV